MKPMNPMISVLMSVYNEPIEWIMCSIDSILSQTLKDIEFIIVNDNPDREELIDLLSKIRRVDNRMNVITNKENFGLTKSLNIGLKECKGKYVARMDADDWAYPHRLKTQYNFMETHPDIIASSAMAYAWDGVNSLRKIYRPSKYSDIIPYTFTSSPFIHPLLIIRLSSIKRYGIKYDEHYRRSQDYKLAVDLLKVGRIANCEDVLLKYRLSDQQITSKFGFEQEQLCKQIRRDYVNNYYLSHNICELEPNITIDTIEENRTYEKELIRQNKIQADNLKEFQKSMQAIRRIMYYSLSKYSFKTFLNFIGSKDYCKYPYNLRRFLVILIKHFRPEFIPKLL